MNLYAGMLAAEAEGAGAVTEVRGRGVLAARMEARGRAGAAPTLISAGGLAVAASGRVGHGMGVLAEVSTISGEVRFLC